MFGLRKLKKKEGRNEMFVCGRRRFFLCNLSSLQKKKKTHKNIAANSFALADIFIRN